MNKHVQGRKQSFRDVLFAENTKREQIIKKEAK